MPFEGKKLIIEVGGDMRPGEKLKGYLRRVAQETGIGVPSLEKSWKGQYESKNTIVKLKQRAADNAKTVASRLETIAADLAAKDSFLAEVLALRDVARRLRSLDRRKEPQENGGK
jgi:hypothetical protein